MGRPKARRKNISGDRKHWLGEGVAGQEVLLDDLDPYFAAVSSGLTKEISRRSRLQDLRGEPTLMWLPESPLCPLMSTLSGLGPVSLITEEHDEVVSSAATEFSVNVFDSSFEESASLKSPYCFVFCLEQVWSSSKSYAMHVRHCLTLLSAGGVVVCLLRGVRRGEETVIEWSKDEFTSLDQLITRGVFPLPPASLAQAVSIGDYFSKPYNSAKEQAKLFKNFYGRGVEDLYLARLREPDISNCLSESSFAVLLYYEV